MNAKQELERIIKEFNIQDTGVLDEQNGTYSYQEHYDVNDPRHDDVMWKWVAGVGGPFAKYKPACTETDVEFVIVLRHPDVHYTVKIVEDKVKHFYSLTIQVLL